MNNQEKIKFQIELYSEWITNQNKKPKKQIEIINGLSNDLKKINKLEHDQHLLLINDVSVLTNLLNIWLTHEPYKAKNDRGNNYYSSAFKKYIKYSEEDGFERDMFHG